MADLPGDLLNTGITASAIGTVGYIILKLLGRYSGSEDYYKDRLAREIEDKEFERKEKEKERKRADDCEKASIKFKAENSTLRKELNAVRSRRRKHDPQDRDRH